MTAPTRRSRRRRNLLAGLAGGAVLLALDAFWLEPRVLLCREDVQLPLERPGLRIAHLSDLHVEREDSFVARRLLRQVAAARPDLIMVSGDWVADLRGADRGRTLARRARSAAALAHELRRTAPVVAVQGHSDYAGVVVAALASSGVEWLSNEGRRVGEGTNEILLLGLNQQVGHDAADPPPAFEPLHLTDGWAVGRHEPEPDDENRYLSWDPSPSALADAGGPLAWSAYEAAVSVRVEGAMDAGLAIHSSYVLGEDRFLRLGGGGAEQGAPPGTFLIVIDGSAAQSGQADTKVAPRPGRWYRLRVRTEISTREVRVHGKAWPAEEAEPPGWQAWLADSSTTRVGRGTVALWTQGRGTAAFRDLRVVDLDGRALASEPFDRPRRPPGWRDGARGTRLALALARSPTVPPGTPRLVLTHSPDAAREAASRGIEAVLAGHTHGGQVRLPAIGALTTRTRLGRRFDRGLFHLAGARPDGTWLYVNPGVGTSFVPVRSWNPPGWALVTVGGSRPPPS